MKWFSVFVLFLLLEATFPANSSPEQKNDEEDGAAHEASQQGLETFRQLITGKTAERFGIKPVGDSSEITLAPFLKVYFIRGDLLKEFKPTDDPEKLVVETKRRIYPIKVQGEVQSSFTVAKTKDGQRWAPTRYATEDRLAPLLVKYREKYKSVYQDAEFSVVQSPELKLFFLGIRTKKDFLLTPLGNKYEFRAGEAIPAKDVFLKLKKVAATYKGGLDDELAEKSKKQSGKKAQPQ